MVKDHINPDHYQAFFKHEELELQWLETKQHEEQFRDPEKFKAAVSLQIEKYLDRRGKKDAELRESRKALWYLKFLTAYIANGNEPILVKDIPTILGEASAEISTLERIGRYILEVDPQRCKDLLYDRDGINLHDCDIISIRGDYS